MSMVFAKCSEGIKKSRLFFLWKRIWRGFFYIPHFLLYRIEIPCLACIVVLSITVPLSAQHSPYLLHIGRVALGFAFLIYSLCRWWKSTTRRTACVSLLSVGLTSTFLVSPVYNLYCLLTADCKWLEQVASNVRNLFPTDALTSTKFGSIPAMIPSLAFVLLFRGLLEWMEKVPAGHINKLKIHQLGWHKFHIMLFEIVYITYLSYWLQNHTGYLLLLALLTVAVLVVDVMLIHYPIWEVNNVIKGNVRYVINSFSDEFFVRNYVDASIDAPFECYVDKEFSDMLNILLSRLGEIFFCPANFEQIAFLCKVVGGVIEEISHMCITEEKKKYVYFAMGLGCTPQNAGNKSIERLEYTLRLDSYFKTLTNINDDSRAYLIAGLYCGALLGSEAELNSDAMKGKWLNQYQNMIESMKNKNNSFLRALT